ncbi:MAG: TolC family protein [Gemmatimonadaceae bacterium]
MICVIVGLPACAGGRVPVTTIPQRPLGRDVPVYLPSSSDIGRPNGPAFETPTDSISLRDAVGLALLHSPELAAFAWETRAREARILQASRPPNPILGVVAEDIGASVLANGVAGNQQAVQPQTTVQLSQLIELGGKRTARQNLAARTRDLAAWDYEAARMNVLTRVTHAFIDVLAAQEMVALTAQTTQIVEQVQRSVGARVVAGVVSPIEETRADVALAAVRVESNRAVWLLDTSRRRLAAHWGASEATFAAGAGHLDIAPALPSITQLTTRLAENPDLARWAVEILQREAALATEASMRLPDLTLTAGYRRFTDLRSNAYVIGVSIPLPVFDRNAGAVEEAKSRLAKAYEERRGAQARVSAGLAEAYGVLASAHDEVTALRTTVLPGSHQTFEAVSEGYRLGKFGYLDVLDAQRTLIAANGQYLRALSDYHKAVADVERLIGAPLIEVSLAPR